MKIFITGDTHSTYNLEKIKRKNWKEGYTLTKKDVLIIAGDFGFLWRHKRTKEEVYWLKWLEDRPWTTCFIDGNHENFDLLDNLQRRDLFGAEVGIVSHSIHHLLRGRIYKIHERRILALGGAHSHDREHREWGVSMWEQEMITDDDIDSTLHNLAIYHNKVDYVVTHCAPIKYAKEAIPLSLVPYWTPDNSETQLQRLLDTGFIFKKWFFGHYHTNSYGDKWVCMFNKIHEIT